MYKKLTHLYCTCICRYACVHVHVEVGNAGTKICLHSLLPTLILSFSSSSTSLISSSPPPSPLPPPYCLMSSCHLPPLQVSSLQKELQQQREVEGSLQTQLGLLRDTLSSKDRELEALRMARAHQERVVKEMRAQVEVKEEECREKVRSLLCGGGSEGWSVRSEGRVCVECERR